MYKSNYNVERWSAYSFNISDLQDRPGTHGSVLACAVYPSGKHSTGPFVLFPQFPSHLLQPDKNETVAGRPAWAKRGGHTRAGAAFLIYSINMYLPLRARGCLQGQFWERLRPPMGDQFLHPLQLYHYLYGGLNHAPVTPRRASCSPVTRCLVPGSFPIRCHHPTDKRPNPNVRSGEFSRISTCP